MQPLLTKDAVVDICRKTAKNRSSMLADCLAVRPMEIETIVSAVIRKANGRNKSLPVLTIIEQMLYAIDRKGEELMNAVISSFLGTIILFPFLVTIVILDWHEENGQSPGEGHWTCCRFDNAIPFPTIYVISYNIFENEVGVYIAAIAITIAILLAFLERSKVKEFRILRLLRKIWRFYFIVLLAVYLILLMIGTILKIVEYVK